MKDVYEKNPQMGDPNSLQPKISETICNMEKLRSEIHKNEVKTGQQGLSHYLHAASGHLLKCILMNRVTDRRGCLRWRESKAPEETEGTALITITMVLKAERGIKCSRLFFGGLMFLTENGPLFFPDSPKIKSKKTDAASLSTLLNLIAAA